METLKIVNLCDYSYAYILVTGDITTTGDENTNVAFKHCAPFTRCVTQINDEHIDTAKNLDIIMRMYNVRDKQNLNNGNHANVATNDSSPFRYKLNILGNAAADGVLRNVKIVV